MTEALRPFVMCLALASCTAAPSSPGVDPPPGDDAGPTALPSAVATQIAVGGLHICALTSTGAVRCWGTSYHGEVGNGGPIDSTDYLVPVQVVGLTSGVVAISAHDGDHTCALTSAGGVLCWGGDAYGQLGTGRPHTDTSITDSATPVAVAGLSSGVKAISAGSSHTCAITAAGGVKCWGFNQYGQLGNDSTEDSNTPVDVVGLSSGVTAIAAGDQHTCAVTAQGGLRCWGSNVDGELGNDSTDTSRVPVDVVGMTSGVAAVSTGRFTTCAITTAGAARCWGLNDVGQVGNGVSSGVGGGGDDAHVPADVHGLATGVTSISTSNELACAVAQGATQCWGSNAVGKLGNNSPGGFQSFIPVGVTGRDHGSAAVGAAYNHACALTTAGAVWCWGEAEGGGGPLGNGTNDSATVPVAVVSLP